MLGDAALINSLHRQAVDQLGEGIVCATRDDSDVIQAIEKSGHIFMIVVQWHPEYLPAMREHQRIFWELVNSARDIKAKSASRSGRRQ